jgi:hypothetical protein
LTAKLDEKTTKFLEQELLHTQITVLINGFCLDEFRSNLFSADSRGNALVPLTGSRNGARGQVLMAVTKLNQ